jgi:hypothetical protein
MTSRSRLGALAALAVALASCTRAEVYVFQTETITEASFDGGPDREAFLLHYAIDGQVMCAVFYDANEVPKYLDYLKRVKR